MIAQCPGETSYSFANGCSSSRNAPSSQVHAFPEQAPPAPALPSVPNRYTQTYAYAPPNVPSTPKKHRKDMKGRGPRVLPTAVTKAAPAVLALAGYRAPELTEAAANVSEGALTPAVPTFDIRKSSELGSAPLGGYVYRYPSGTALYGSVTTPAHYYLYPTGSYRYCASANSATCISGVPTTTSATASNSSGSGATASDTYAYQVPQSTGYYYTEGTAAYVWVSVTTSSYFYVPSAGASEYYWAPHLSQRGFYYQPPSAQGYFWDGGGQNWSYYPERESVAHYVANEGGVIGYVSGEAMYRYQTENESWQQVQDDPELEEAGAPEEAYSEEVEETAGPSYEEQPPTSPEEEGQPPQSPAETEPPGTTPSTETTPPSTTLPGPEIPSTSTPAPEANPQATLPEPPPPLEPQSPPTHEPQPSESSGESSEGESDQQDTTPEEPFY
jgi:hypothetical protein